MNEDEEEDEIRRVDNSNGQFIGQGLQSSLKPNHLFSGTDGEVEPYVSQEDGAFGIPSLQIGSYESLEGQRVQK